VDVFLNLLLFLPLGFGLRLAAGSWRAALGGAALLSLGVELLQLTVVTGRDASLSDLLTNTTGGGLGGLIAARLGLLCRPAPRAAGRLFAAGAAVWVAFLSASAWLQRPDSDRPAIQGAWATGRAPDEFTGRVLDVRLNDRPVPPRGLPADSAVLRQALREGRFALETRVVSPEPAESRRWIYLITTAGVPYLFLSQHRTAALLGVPSRAKRFRLNPPSLTLRHAFPRDSGVPVELRAGQDGTRLWLSSSRPGAVGRVSATLSPGRGWTLVAPYFLPPGPRERVVTGMFLAALMLPLGYWARLTGRRAVALAGIAGTLAAGLVLVPELGGYQATAWWEWAGAAGGAAAGWVLARAAAYLQPRCASPSAGEFSSS
jgi:hypothetical protein